MELMRMINHAFVKIVMELGLTIWVLRFIFIAHIIVYLLYFVGLGLLYL